MQFVGHKVRIPFDRIDAAAKKPPEGGFLLRV
jgi:hypothetical protein